MLKQEAGLTASCTGYTFLAGNNPLMVTGRKQKPNAVKSSWSSCFLYLLSSPIVPYCMKLSRHVNFANFAI